METELAYKLASAVWVALLAVALAAAIEALAEFLLGMWLDFLPPTYQHLKTPLMKSTAALVGVLVAVRYWLDLFTLIPDVPPTEVGVVITGLLLGRGATAVHDFITDYLLGGKE